MPTTLEASAYKLGSNFLRSLFFVDMCCKFADVRMLSYE